MIFLTRGFSLCLTTDGTGSKTFGALLQESSGLSLGRTTSESLSSPAFEPEGRFRSELEGFFCGADPGAGPPRPKAGGGGRAGFLRGVVLAEDPGCAGGGLVT